MVGKFSRSVSSPRHFDSLRERVYSACGNTVQMVKSWIGRYRCERRIGEDGLSSSYDASGCEWMRVEASTARSGSAVTDTARPQYALVARLLSPLAPRRDRSRQVRFPGRASRSNIFTRAESSPTLYTPRAILFGNRSEIFNSCVPSPGKRSRNAPRFGACLSMSASIRRRNPTETIAAKIRSRFSVVLEKNARSRASVTCFELRDPSASRTRATSANFYLIHAAAMRSLRR